jgi:LCP family protein required for cell wall assembly
VRTPRHTVAKVLTSSLLVLGLVTGVGVNWIYQHLNGNLKFSNVDPLLGTDRPVDPGPQGALNVLVMGSDSREGKGNGVDGEGGGGSDTTILMHLSADRKSAYGISIPRDTVVDRPECYTKSGQTVPAADGVLWNAAFNEGGQACTIRQFEQLTDVRIDNYVVVDFNGFKNMVDAVKGVDICVPEEIDDPYTGLHLDRGDQTIKGDQALNYVRLRHGVGDGSDIGRIKRQQAFIAAMVNKVVSGGTLARPDRILGFLNAVTKSLEIDFTSLLDLAKVGNQFNGVGLKRIQFITVPFAYYPVDSDNKGRVYWTDDAKNLWSRVAADSSLGAFRDGAINAAKPPQATPTPSPDSDPTPTPTESPSASPSTGLDADEAASVGLCG